MKKRRALTISFLVLVLLFGVASGLVMRGYWRKQAGRELIFAIKANDANRALDALRAHADPNVRDQGEEVFTLRTYLSELWLQMRGIKPAPPTLGSRAIALAVHQGNAAITEALLARGARVAGETYTEEIDIPVGGRHWVSYSSEVTMSLMEAAARHGNVAIIRALAKHGCDVNEVNKEHSTPLFFANNAETVKALIACGADRAARDAEGRTALDYNIWAGDEDVADGLLDSGQYDPAAMQEAIAFGHIEPLKRMLALGWKVDALDAHKATPLMCALAFGGADELDAAMILLAHSADVNHQDARGNTPLMFAARGGRFSRMQEASPKIVDALLKRGARIDAQDAEGKTPLMIAASHLRPILVRLLLKHGARVDLKTKTGETALSMAHRRDYAHVDNARDQAQVIRLLKKAGAKE